MEGIIVIRWNMWGWCLAFPSEFDVWCNFSDSIWKQLCRRSKTISTSKEAGISFDDSTTHEHSIMAVW